MATAVVTGGAGFLGSHLCDYLLARGYRVICVDNLDTGTLQNVEHVRDDAFVFVTQDVIEHIEIAEPVDVVFHLASPASPIDYMRLPLHTLKVGSYGTHNALGLAKFKRARFLLASTSEVYGDPQVHPQPETYWGNVNPIGPRGVYDEAKRYAEALTMAYHRQQGVDTSIARIFNTYGPRMRPHDGRAIPTFVRQALEGKPVTVFGDGSQTRSFCYVDDLVRGLFLLADSEEHLPVNLGNPDEWTLLELAELVIRMTGSSSEIVFEALPIDDPQVRQPDITGRAARWTGSRRSASRTACARLSGRWLRAPREWQVRRQLAALVAVVVAFAAAGPAAHASSSLRFGIYEEAETLFTPTSTKGYSTIDELGAKVLRLNLYWYRVSPSRPSSSRTPSTPPTIGRCTTAQSGSRPTAGSACCSRSGGRPAGRTAGRARTTLRALSRT